MYRNILSAVFIGCFLLLLCLPLCMLVTGTGPAPIVLSENRSLAMAPQWATSPVHTWPDQIERWLQDHLPLRSHCIWLYADTWTRLLYSPRTRYVHGRNGLFFPFGPESPTVQNALGMNPLTAQQLTAIKQAYTGAMAYFAIQNIPYRVYMFPDKATVEFANLPFWAKWKHGAGWYEQLLQALQETPVSVVGMAEELRAHTTTKPVFSKIFDSWHWNGTGKALALNHIAAMLAARFPALSEMELNETLFLHPVSLTENLWREEVMVLEASDKAVREQASLKNRLAELSAVSQQQASNLAYYFTSDKKEAPSVWLFSDSYLGSNALGATVLPFVSKFSSFIQLHFHTLSLPYLEKLLEIEKPNMVIDAFVERTGGHQQRAEDPLIRIYADALLAPAGHALTPKNFGSVTDAMHGMQSEATDNSVLLHIVGSDPQVLLRPVTTGKDGRAVVMMRLLTPHDDVVELFAAVDDAPFSQENAVSALVPAGENLLHLQLFMPPGAKVRLRLDPGSKPGIYTLLPLPEVKSALEAVRGI